MKNKLKTRNRFRPGTYVLLSVIILAGFRPNGDFLATAPTPANAPQEIRRAEILIERGNDFAREGRFNDALLHYKSARKILIRLRGKDSALYAVARYNSGIAQEGRGRPEIAAGHHERAREILQRLGLTNSTVYLEVLLHQANLLFEQKKPDTRRRAGEIYDKIDVAARMLGLDSSAVRAASLHNRAVLALTENNQRLARLLFKQAYLIFRKLDLSLEANASRQNDARLIAPGPRSTDKLPYRNSFGLTPEEETLLKSYTGMFDLEKHPPSVRARTYQGRQDDTNVFFSHLLDPQQTQSSALNKIRRDFLGGTKGIQGEGVVFVDIGPAVANRKDPAVTSRSMARDFPKMQVVALDLPREVKLFHKVPKKFKFRLYRHQNMHIFSGNGLESLKQQFSVKENWAFADRQPPVIAADTPLAVRSANAIDIYVDYSLVRPSIQLLAQDFKSNPLLYFFNRTIMFKPRGETAFHFIGFVSIRGFHHNKASFNRGGDRPFTLAELD